MTITSIEIKGKGDGKYIVSGRTDQSLVSEEQIQEIIKTEKRLQPHPDLVEAVRRFDVCVLKTGPLRSYVRNKDHEEIRDIHDGDLEEITVTKLEFKKGWDPEAMCVVVHYKHKGLDGKSVTNKTAEIRYGETAPYKPQQELVSMVDIVLNEFEMYHNGEKWDVEVVGGQMSLLDKETGEIMESGVSF